MPEPKGKLVTPIGIDADGKLWALLVDADGHLQIDVVASGLPTGAATETTLGTLATDAKLELVRLLLVSLDAKDFATQVTLAALLTELRLKADLTETQPVSAAALPLPLGAATEATIATLATDAKLELVRLLLVSIDGIDFATGTDIGTILTELQRKADLTETQPVSQASQPLPTGAATQATLATLATEAKLELVRLLLVSLEGKDFATGTDIGTILTELQLKADLTETQPVAAASLPLPAGAATAAHQVTIQGYIDTLETLLNGGLPAALDAGALKIKEQSPLTGFATQATLATLATDAKLELVRLLLVSLEGKDFSTETTLAALLTELQLKADLTETQPVSAASLPLPTGAATAAHQTTMITALQLIDDLRNALNSVGADLLRVSSKSGDKIFAFESIVEEEVVNISLPAGNQTLSATVCPPNKIQKITHVTAYMKSTSIDHVQVYISGLAVNLILIDQYTPTNKQYYFWSGELYLQEGDQIKLLLENCTLNDDAFLNLTGVQMNVP